ncbi:MAG: SHOCT domain-containing protein [Rhodospirillales bacterium]
MRAFFVSLAALPVILWAASAAWAQPQTGPDYGPHMWGGGSWMFFGPLMMLVFIAAIVIVVVLVVRWLGGPGHGTPSHAPPGKTPVDILKERFALGEIDKEEFEERRRALGE